MRPLLQLVSPGSSIMRMKAKPNIKTKYSTVSDFFLLRKISKIPYLLKNIMRTWLEIILDPVCNEMRGHCAMELNDN